MMITSITPRSASTDASSVPLPTPIALQVKPSEQVLFLSKLDGTGGYLARAGNDPQAAVAQAIEAARKLSAGDAPAAVVFQGAGDQSVFDVYVGQLGIADKLDPTAGDVKPYVLTGGEVVTGGFALAVVDGDVSATMVDSGP